MDSGAVFWIIALCLYFLPTVIAIGREHRNTGAIFVVDLFLGWTLVGWVVALAWSVSAQRERA